MDTQQPDYSEPTLLEQWMAGEDETLETVYAQARSTVLPALQTAGATEKEALSFLKVALLEVWRTTQQHTFSDESLLLPLTQAIALAQYEDWRLEHKADAPPTPMPPPAITAWIPDKASLRRTRMMMYAWQHPALYTNEEWAQTALADSAGRTFWRKLEAAEQKTGTPSSVPTPAPTTKSDNTIRYVFVLLALLTLGWWGYRAFFTPKPPVPTGSTVFADNFSPPTSIMADLARRTQAATEQDSLHAHQACIDMLQAADTALLRNDRLAAKKLLIELSDTSTSSMCTSDAYYYLAMLFLQEDAPEEAMYCLAKVENLEAYGEDVMWFQALSLVQMSAQEPDLRDKAARALGRVANNAVDSLRRERARTMMRDLHTEKE